MHSNLSLPNISDFFQNIDVDKKLEKASSLKENCKESENNSIFTKDVADNLTSKYSNKLNCQIVNNFNTTDVQKTILVSEKLQKGNSRFYCKHEKCQKSFLRLSSLKGHMEICDKKIKPKQWISYICPVCNKEFRNMYLLKRHYIVHSGKRSFICDDCSEAFGQKDTLITHIKIRHYGIKHDCNICPATFRYKGNLTKHKSTVHCNKTNQQKLLKCPCCDSHFRKKHTLSIHHAKYHQNLTEEDKIQKTIKDVIKDLQSQNNVSEETIQEEKLLSSYYLDVAYAKYYIDGKAWFKCKKCNAIFKKPYSLMRHSKIHINSGPHQCCVCNETFRIKTALIHHKLNVHNIRVKRCATTKRKVIKLNEEENDTMNPDENQQLLMLSLTTNANKSIDMPINDAFNQRETFENKSIYQLNLDSNIINFEENYQDKDLRQKLDPSLKLHKNDTQNSLVYGANVQCKRSIRDMLEFNQLKENTIQHANGINSEEDFALKNASPILTDLRERYSPESPNLRQATMQDDQVFTLNSSNILNFSKNGMEDSLMKNPLISTIVETNIEKQLNCKVINDDDILSMYIPQQNSNLEDFPEVASLLKPNLNLDSSITCQENFSNSNIDPCLELYRNTNPNSAISNINVGCTRPVENIVGFRQLDDNMDLYTNGTHFIEDSIMKNTSLISTDLQKNFNLETSIFNQATTKANVVNVSNAQIDANTENPNTSKIEKPKLKILSNIRVESNLFMPLIYNNFICGDKTTATHTSKQKPIVNREEIFISPNANISGITSNPGCEIQNSVEKLFDYEYTHSSKSESKKSEIKHACVHCGKLFHKQFSLIAHTRRHTKIGVFKCEVCSKKFTYLNSLRNHKRIHLPDSERLIYNCKECDKNFATKGSLKLHTTIHNNVLNYSCPLCDKKFRTPVAKSLHFQKIHLLIEKT